MFNPDMMKKIATGNGFIAALDQSGGSTPKALKGYGIESDSYANDDEMFALIHAMRSRIIMSPSFTGNKVVGAILFEKTMDGEAGGKPVPQALWEKGVVPFLKVDKGLEEESSGVQMMKPMPELDLLCKKATGNGIFGTKMRSVINRADAGGIADIVEQQFAVASQILDHGLMPIIEPEVNIKSGDRADSDAILKDKLIAAVEKLPANRQVMLKLSIPAQANLYAPLVNHPKILRVVALSGGFTRNEACTELAKNSGMIASFSRALLENLRDQMNDAEFDQSLASAISDIYDASIS